MIESKRLKVFSDGGSLKNPGPSALGIAAFNDKNKLVLKKALFLGKKTNNQAEYLGVIESLKEIKRFKPEKVDFFLDSELVVKQLNGEYKIKEKTLMTLVQAMKKLEKDFKEINFYHIGREKNKLADGLVKEVLKDYRRR